MENKTLRTLAITALVVAVGGLTLGYAALTQVLTINTDAKVQKSDTSWKIKFQNADAGVATGDAVKGSIALTETDVTVSGVVLKAPNDKVTYTFEVTNAGDIDATLSTIVLKNPTVTGTGDTKDADETLVKNNYYTYTLSYSDGTTPTNGDVLNSGETKTIKLEISMNDVTQLPANDVTITGLGATLTYVQK